jgi:hypothetical protein
LARSPVPTQITDGSGWNTAISPTECTGSFSNTGAHVTPLSVVRKTPPVDDATYMV